MLMAGVIKNANLKFEIGNPIDFQVFDRLAFKWLNA